MIRNAYHTGVVLACMLLAGFWTQSAGQDLQTTCPLVKAAVCLGYCSATPPSLVRHGYCSARRRGLLAQSPASTPAAVDSSRVPTTTSSSSTPAQHLPRADWKLQAPAAARAGAGDAAEWGDPSPTAANGPAAEVPQKYLPYGMNGTDPPETPEQQEQIRQHLDDVLSQPDNSTDAAAGDTEVWQNPPGETQTEEDISSGADGGAAAGGSSPGSGSSSSSGTGSGGSKSGGSSSSTSSTPTGVTDTAPSSPPPASPAATSPDQQDDSQPSPAPDKPQQQPPSQAPQQQQQQQQCSHSFLPFKFTWLPLWFPHFHHGRRLQQEDPQKLPAEQQQQDAPPEVTAIPLLGPQATDPSTAAANSISSPQDSPQCPAGSVLNTTEGTCISSTDAFSTSTEETPEITTVTLEVPAGQQEGPAPAAREAPIDPGTQQTVVLGPDGVAIGVGSGGGAAGGSGGGSGDLSREVAPYSGPVSQVSRTLTMIGNSKIKVGVDLDRAGTISWVSSPLMPAPWTNQNIINNWDQGRLLQQSFYGCVDGSCWANRPWLWNPVQGGSWQNAPGLTTKQLVKTGGYVYAEGYGRNWGKQDLIKDVKFTTNVTLLDNVAVVKYTMDYAGSITHNYMTQEVPAVFVDRKFSVLAYYNGASPWKYDKAGMVYAFPPGRNVYARPTEFWAAYIDPNTGWGLGVYNPMAWMGITAYRIGPDGADSRPWDCSYFAHTIRMQLHPGMKAYPYTVYITVGRLDTIRATFYKLRTQPSVVAAQASTTAATRSLTPTPTPTPSPSQEPVRPQKGQLDLGRNMWYGQPLNYSMFDNVLQEGGVAAQQQQGSGSGSESVLDGRTIPVDSVGDGTVADRGSAGQGKALTRGQFTGVLVGAVGGCLLMAIVVVTRAVQQRRRAAAAAAAAAADSRAELLCAHSNPASRSNSYASYSPSRSPSKAGPSRSRAHSTVAQAGNGSPAAVGVATAPGGVFSSSGSPVRTSSRTSGAAAGPAFGIGAAEGGDGAVSVRAVTPGIVHTPVTRSTAKLGK